MLKTGQRVAVRGQSQLPVSLLPVEATRQLLPARAAATQRDLPANRGGGHCLKLRCRK